MELANNTASVSKASEPLEYVRREFAGRILAEQAIVVAVAAALIGEGEGRECLVVLGEIAHQP